MFWLKFTQDYQLSVATGSRNEEFEIQFQAFSLLTGITAVCTPPDSRRGEGGGRACTATALLDGTLGAEPPGTNPNFYLTLAIGINVRS